MLDEHDAMLMEVIARDLESLAGAEAGHRGPLGMMAGLIRTLELGGAKLAPAADRQIDTAVLKSYLVRKAVIGNDATVSILRTALGFSKDTYLVTVTQAGREPTTLAIRRNLPAGPSRTTVVDEYPLLMDLYRHGFTVPEPLLIEPDPAPLGQPFMLSRGMPGSPEFTTVETDPRTRVKGARQLARFLARLHTLPIADVSVRRVAPGAGANEELAAYFAEWRGFWEECGPAQFAEMFEAFEILESNLPDLQELVLVHSDVGFHNILVEDGSFTAVLDWEFTHLGEPEEDLSYARPSIEELVGWDEFLTMYQEAGGPTPSPQRLKAYEIWRSLRNATCCALGRVAFESGLNADLRLAYAGRVILNMSVAAVLEQLKAATSN